MGWKCAKVTTTWCAQMAQSTLNPYSLSQTVSQSGSVRAALGNRLSAGSCFKSMRKAHRGKAAVPFRHDFDVKPIDREDGKQSALMGVVIWQKPIV